MTTLVIVNCQSDYITGTISTKGTRTILEPIKKYIKIHKDDIAKIIFVVDWHPYNHCSFKNYGGDMQYHCVQYTPGACIEPKLLKFVQALGIPYDVSKIGECEHVDELGAFNDIDPVNDNFGNRYYLDEVIVDANDTNFVVCGVGDVLYGTLDNLLKCFSPKVYMPGIYAQEINKYIKDNGIEKENL
jgi:nicotinamidase/pyrazinamidase